LHDVLGLLLGIVARASGDRVQHRLIDIRWLAVDQRHGDDDVMRTRHCAFLLCFAESLQNAILQWRADDLENAAAEEGLFSGRRAFQEFQLQYEIKIMEVSYFGAVPTNTVKAATLR
jgi:hypothetical protein